MAFRSGCGLEAAVPRGVRVVSRPLEREGKIEPMRSCERKRLHLGNIAVSEHKNILKIAREKVESVQDPEKRSRRSRAVKRVYSCAHDHQLLQMLRAK